MPLPTTSRYTCPKDTSLKSFNLFHHPMNALQAFCTPEHAELCKFNCGISVDACCEEPQNSLCNFNLTHYIFKATMLRLKWPDLMEMGIGCMQCHDQFS